MVILHFIFQMSKKFERIPRRKEICLPQVLFHRRRRSFGDFGPSDESWSYTGEAYIFSYFFNDTRLKLKVPTLCHSKISIQNNSLLIRNHSLNSHIWRNSSLESTQSSSGITMQPFQPCAVWKVKLFLYTLLSKSAVMLR